MRIILLGGNIILKPKLYDEAKAIVYNQYPKHSAYRSGQLVKKYKELGGTYGGEKPTGNLTSWFKEDWKDINPNKTKNSYPVFRPTIRVNKNTPLTASEIDPKNLKEQIALKQKIKGKKNLPNFKAKKGKGVSSDSDDDSSDDELEYGGKLGRDELKGLLDASYDGREKVGDWTIDKQLSTKTSKVYSKGDRAVVAHRGTEGITDWGNNLAFALGGEYLYKKTDRFKEAEKVQKKAEKKYGANNVSTIGHSQGGLQAELLGSKSKEIITLNKATHPLIKRHSGNQTDIRSDRDIVSIATKTPTTEIKAESYNPLKEHSPDILNRVSADTEYGRGVSSPMGVDVVSYKISPQAKIVAKKLGVKIEPSKKKFKKIDVFDFNNQYITSVGDTRYNDYRSYIKEKGIEYADTRRRLYKIRHQRNRLIEGSPSYYADQLLW